MRKKDMYIRYKRNVHYSRGKIAMYIACIVFAAALVGTFTFFGIRLYKEKKALDDIVPQQVTKAEQQTEAEVASDAEPTASLGEVVANGPFGMWYKNEAANEPTKSPYEEDVWMSDFVDTRQRIEAKGIYVSAAYAERYLDEAIAVVDRTEINSIVIDIKGDSGLISYQMDYDEAKKIGATSNIISNIDDFVKMCKEHDIYLIARVVALKDPVLAEGRPELALKRKDGTIFRDNSGLAWVNPYKQEVWDYLAEVSKHIAEVGFNEINYDYIRFCTDSGMSEVDFGEGSDELTRIEVITAGIKGLCEILKPMGVFVSCDVYGSIINSSVDAKIVGQSYRKMASYLDYICPMVYPSHYGDGCYKLDYPDLHPYELVMAAMEDSKKTLSTIPEDENKAIVRPWLQDFTASWLSHYQEYGDKQLNEQKSAVYESGYTQFLVWNAACNYHENALKN